MADIWLPEPVIEDDSWAYRGEHTLNWLARSTLPRATACRAFLNENISKLPGSAQESFLNAFQHRFKSAFFELIVARTLQILGAAITVEAEQEDGKQPDFLAQFKDCTIVVEAKSPNFELETGNQLKERIPLTDIVESLTPEGWAVGILKLPRIGPADSKKEFKRTIAKMLSLSPPEQNSKEFDLIEELPTGKVHLHLIPKPPNWRPIAWEEPIIHIGDSKERIQNAIKRKRRQVREAEYPVLLAIEGSSFNSDMLEDFDTALFGHVCGVMNVQGEIEQYNFIPDGMFTNISDKPPTYAGVIVFPEVGIRSVANPILYHHPRFKGDLPQEVLVLEQRWYESGKGKNSIKSSPSNLRNLPESLGLVKV